MENFWINIKKPISASAPMAGVTDVAYRQILLECGKPDVIWTEMISLAGISIRGISFFENEMKFTNCERPIVFQFFGSTPEHFSLCGDIVLKYKASGIDINMGCPDNGIEKQGAGASIIKNPSLAKEIVLSAIEHSKGAPVSLKTRLGYSSVKEMEVWITSVAEARPSAITIHGRTRAEKRKGKANWEAIGRATKLIKSISPNTIVLGNGDVGSKQEGELLSKEFETDGYMIGRALIGNPWVFTNHTPSKTERLLIAKKHIQIFNDLLGKDEPFDLIKKHFAGYISGFVGAKELRVKLMHTKNTLQAIEALGL